MTLIALRTLFHFALTAKITETISDYIVEYNHLKDEMIANIHILSIMSLNHVLISSIL